MRRAPRRMAWFAADAAWWSPFSRSHGKGLRAHALRSAPWVERLLQVASAAAGCEFNACLLNAYRIGSEFAAWHADDDPWLDAAAPIASISLGAERDFLVRPKVQNAARQPEDFDGADVAAFRLRHGSMLVMEAGAQEGWRHALPPCADAGARVNLTFRRVDPARVHLQHDGRTLKQNWGS